MHGHTATYPPLNTLKPVAENVWIVDGPVIRFGMPWPKMPFPTRMTVVRLADGGLFLHSPTPFTEELAAEIDAAGKVRHLVGPNRIHYWWIPDWRQAYPQAETWLAPGIPEQAQGRIDFETKELAGGSGYPWDEEMDTLPVRGDYMTEFVFFHRASRTLIVTDLIENFEPRKLGLAMRLMTRIGGVLDPDGQMPRDMRLTFRNRKAELRAAVERMIALEPERIVLAHGRWYDRDGTTELKRAFRWIL
jgi:hypothetical protein